MIQRKQIQAAFVLMLVIGTLLLLSSSAQAASITSSPHSIRGTAPYASGGGCNRSRTVSPRGDIAADGCISYGWPNLLPDGYVSIWPLSTVQSCYVDVQIYGSNGNFITSQRYSCRFGANVHYGPYSYFTLSGTYYGCVDVHLFYRNGSSSTVTNCSYFEYV